MALAISGTEGTAELNATDGGEHDIKNDEVNSGVGERIPHLVPAFNATDTITLPLKGALHEGAHPGVIFKNENAGR